MTLWTESELDDLRYEFGPSRTDGRPPRDVDRLARLVANEHERSPVRSPFGVLRYRLRGADRSDEFRLEAYRETERYPSAPLGERSDPGYAAFRFKLIARILADGLTPREVAEILEQYQPACSHLPGVAALLEFEIAEYGARGDYWDYRVHPPTNSTLPEART